MSDISILMYSPDGNVGRVYESIQNSIGDFRFKFITTGPVRPNYKCSDWYESFLRPVPSLQKLLYEVRTDFVTFISDDAIYEPLSLSRLIENESKREDEGITILRAADNHIFLPLSRVGYLTELGCFDCEHPTLIDACNDFTTRVFRDGRRVSVSSSIDITVTRDHMKSRNLYINPSSVIINLDNWKYV